MAKRKSQSAVLYAVKTLELPAPENAEHEMAEPAEASDQKAIDPSRYSAASRDPMGLFKRWDDIQEILTLPPEKFTAKDFSFYHLFLDRKFNRKQYEELIKSITFIRTCTVHDGSEVATLIDYAAEYIFSNDLRRYVREIVATKRWRERSKNTTFKTEEDKKGFLQACDDLAETANLILARKGQKQKEIDSLSENKLSHEDQTPTDGDEAPQGGERGTAGMAVNAKEISSNTGIPLRERFCAAVTAARENLGLSKAEVARRLGMHPSDYGHIENGKTNPRLDTIEKIEDVLGLRFVNQ